MHVYMYEAGEEVGEGMFRFTRWHVIFFSFFSSLLSVLHPFFCYCHDYCCMH